jgi:peptide alpha-N-acetyltransferase
MSSFTERNFPDVEFLSYKDEGMLADVQRLVSADLSEPYSVYLYRYFIHTWPSLCICGYLVDPTTRKRGEMIACVVCKAEEEASGTVGLQGYIAMLAVNKAHRKRGLGIELVSRGIQEMKRMGCTEVYLEAEESNKGALALYEKLGFSREERFLKYYLNGSNAFRLKLWIDANNPDNADTDRSLGADMGDLKVAA